MAERGYTGEDGQPGHLHGHVTGIEHRTDGRQVEGVIWSNLSDDDAREVVGENLGIDPSKVELQKTSNSSRSGRPIFGISNWAGCNWEPVGPNGTPKADPKLN